MDIKQKNANEMFDILKSICDSFLCGNKSMLSAKIAQAILFVSEIEEVECDNTKKFFKKP
jgi:hypothetical protein